MWAITNRHKVIAKILLDHGASPDIKSSSGGTAYDFVQPGSEFSQYLHEHGYHIGGVALGTDFYDSGLAQDRFEEEMAENEMKRRMLMQESAANLEVDLSTLGFDEQPEVCPPVLCDPMPLLIGFAVARRPRGRRGVHMGEMCRRSDVCLSGWPIRPDPQPHHHVYDTTTIAVSKTSTGKSAFPDGTICALSHDQNPTGRVAVECNGQDQRRGREAPVGHDHAGLLDIECYSTTTLSQERRRSCARYNKISS